MLADVRSGATAFGYGVGRLRVGKGEDLRWTHLSKAFLTILPRTLLALFMLVSALMGLDRMKTAYAHAIENDYRFYSYGDAPLGALDGSWRGSFRLLLTMDTQARLRT